MSILEGPSRQPLKSEVVAEAAVAPEASPCRLQGSLKLRKALSSTVAALVPHELGDERHLTRNQGPHKHSPCMLPCIIACSH